MKKLYNTIEQKVSSYPRDDDELIIGLDPSFIVLNVIDNDVPIYSTLQKIKQVETVDTDALTVTYSWNIVNLSAEEIAMNAAMDASVKLRIARSAMASIFDSLSLEVRASLFTVRVSVNAALDLGDVALAKLLIQNTAVSSDMQSFKDQILALFP